ncbi:MAG: cellulase family glycosylhydrolase [Planctomycetia bacterium]|nr:cellulase family glycosylhydrolase [Planctomycetia bacterium]
MYLTTRRRSNGTFAILIAGCIIALSLIPGCNRRNITTPASAVSKPSLLTTVRPYGRMKRLTAAAFLHSQRRGFVFGDGNEALKPFRNFALTGANIMRVFINVNRNYKGTTYVLTPQIWHRMNLCADMGDRYHFRVVFVLSVNQARLWNSAVLQASIVDVWGKIAAHFKNRRSIAGFDILNEPAAAYASKGGYVAWRTFAIAIIKRIGQVDASRICIVETPPYWPTTYAGTVWGRPIKPRPYARFVHLPFSNLVYSFHMYEPLSITAQGLPGYPGVHLYPTKIWNYKTLLALVKPVKAFQEKYHVPIYVGEFSCIRWAPDGTAVRYVHDCIRIFNKEGWSWTYHAFDEYNGWDPELPQTAPRQLPNGVPAVNFKPWISIHTPMMKMIERYLRWNGEKTKQ